MRLDQQVASFLDVQKTSINKKLYPGKAGVNFPRQKHKNLLHRRQVEGTSIAAVNNTGDAQSQDNQNVAERRFRSDPRTETMQGMLPPNLAGHGTWPAQPQAQTHAGPLPQTTPSQLQNLPAPRNPRLRRTGLRTLPRAARRVLYLRPRLRRLPEADPRRQPISSEIQELVEQRGLVLESYAGRPELDPITYRDGHPVLQRPNTARQISTRLGSLRRQLHGMPALDARRQRTEAEMRDLQRRQQELAVERRRARGRTGDDTAERRRRRLAAVAPGRAGAANGRASR